jgi:hypothetical protein
VRRIRSSSGTGAIALTLLYGDAAAELDEEPAQPAPAGV